MCLCGLLALHDIFSYFCGTIFVLKVQLNPKQTNSHYGLSGNCLPQLAKNFVWADGHWAFYSTYQVNICVGLLNLLLQMCFQESKWLNMCRRPGPCYLELTVLPRPLSGQRGKRMRGEERMGTGNERRVGNRYGILERGEKGKRREGRRGEMCDPSFSSYIHQCLQNSFTLWKQDVTG